jgi:hypothetical protein
MQKKYKKANQEKSIFREKLMRLHKALRLKTSSAQINIHAQVQKALLRYSADSRIL